MILVTGATGTVGSEVVRLLAARGERVRAMTRDPARAAFPPEVTIVRGDFDDPDSLAHAAATATAVFLLTAPGPHTGRHDEAMVAAARSAGAGRLVKLSAIGSDAPEPSSSDWHVPGEAAVRSSGAAWTLLRPSAFASNSLRWATPIRAGRPVPNPTGAGAQGVIDPRDVAEVAVEALTVAEHEGQVYTLTGPAPLSVPDQVGCLEEVLGRAIGTVDVPLDAVRDQMLAAGRDPEFVEVAVKGLGLVAAGGNARVTDDVERVLGRPPRTFATWARDHASAF
jgi:uncharacterized protein YbjT (DUF2867 family)